VGYEQFARNREPWVRLSKSRVSCILLLCEPDVHRVAIADRDGAIAGELPNLEYPWRADKFGTDRDRLLAALDGLEARAKKKEKF